MRSRTRTEPLSTSSVAASRPPENGNARSEREKGTERVKQMALRRNSMKWPIGGGFRISGCRLRSPARPWTGGLPSGLQELHSFPGTGRVTGSHDRPAIPLELLHSMKAERSFTPPTALLPGFDTRRLAPVPGSRPRSGTGVAPSPALGKCQPLRLKPAGSQRGVDSCKTVSASEGEGKIPLSWQSRNVLFWRNATLRP